MKKRPTLDSDIFLEAATELSKDVLVWLQNEYSNIEQEDLIKELTEVLEDNFYLLRRRRPPPLGGG